MAVLVAGFVVGVGLLVASSVRGPRPPAPEAAEHWLVARAARRPRLRRAAELANRHVFGGVSIALAVIVVVVAGTAVGLLFDSLDTQRGFARWDDSVAEWGADVATATSTDVLGVITYAGSTAVLAVMMAAVGVVDYGRRRRPAVFGFLATVGIGIVVINNALKLVVDRDRPPVEHLVRASGSSFPSGHSAAAAACWAAMALTMSVHLRARHRPWLVAAATGIAVAVGASRALLGVHWLTDIIAGLIVGWAWFLLSALAFGGRVVRLGEPVNQVGAMSRTQSELWASSI